MFSLQNESQRVQRMLLELFNVKPASTIRQSEWTVISYNTLKITLETVIESIRKIRETFIT